MKPCRRCAFTDMDYSRVKEGHLECRACGREWHLTHSLSKDGTVWRRWVADPAPQARGIHASPYRTWRR